MNTLHTNHCLRLLGSGSSKPESSKGVSCLRGESVQAGFRRLERERSHTMDLLARTAPGFYLFGCSEKYLPFFSSFSAAEEMVRTSLGCFSFENRELIRRAKGGLAWRCGYIHTPILVRRQHACRKSSSAHLFFRYDPPSYKL